MLLERIVIAAHLVPMRHLLPRLPYAVNATQEGTLPLALLPARTVVLVPTVLVAHPHARSVLLVMFNQTPVRAVVLDVAMVHMLIQKVRRLVWRALVALMLLVLTTAYVTCVPVVHTL